jgi:hypothetical protein
MGKYGYSFEAMISTALVTFREYEADHCDDWQQYQEEDQ